MLNGVDALGQRFCSVVWQDGDARLGNGWAGIHALVHKVYGDACCCYPGTQRLPDSIFARKRG